MLKHTTRARGVVPRNVLTLRCDSSSQSAVLAGCCALCPEIGVVIWHCIVLCWRPKPSLEIRHVEPKAFSEVLLFKKALVSTVLASSAFLALSLARQSCLRA